MMRIKLLLNTYNTYGIEYDKARLRELLRELRRFSALAPGQMAGVHGGKRATETH